MTLDDSVLRGYCQKCGCPIFMNDEKAYHTTNAKLPITMALYGQCSKMDPIWFLNAKQMKTISSHKLFAEFGKGNYRFNSTRQGAKPHLIQRITTLCDFLDTNPFLVAQILQENDKE